jgi:hypothetical protein
LVGFGSSETDSTISSPRALRSISERSSSRYSSRYFSGSKSELSESISCPAISISRFSSLRPSSGIRSSPSSAGATTSSANRIVAIVSTLPIGRIAARFSRLRRTNLAIATFLASLIALTSSA